MIFSWNPALLYIHPSSVASTSQDLRQITRPLLERLSPACAGQTGDDHADAQAIRDDWVRLKARDLSRHGRRCLTWVPLDPHLCRPDNHWERRMRLGTFNVNGKMPSQDLSAWVQTSVNTTSRSQPNIVSSALPPAKNRSPLDLGKGFQNPFTRRESLQNCCYMELTALSSFWPIQVRSWSKYISARGAYIAGRSHRPGRSRLAGLRISGARPLHWGVDLFDWNCARRRVVPCHLCSSRREGSKIREGHPLHWFYPQTILKIFQLVSRQLVGMLIVIIAKKCLKDCFGNIRSSAAGAGILGVMVLLYQIHLTDYFESQFHVQGNKGGTAIRLSFTPPGDNSGGISKASLGSTSLTFVNAHLAAFDDMVDKRNSDFQDLSKRLLFEGIPARPSSPAPESEGGVDDSMSSGVPATPSLGLPPTLRVYETDALFWLVSHRVWALGFLMITSLQGGALSIVGFRQIHIANGLKQTWITESMRRMLLWERSFATRTGRMRRN